MNQSGIGRFKANTPSEGMLQATFVPPDDVGYAPLSFQISLAANITPSRLHVNLSLPTLIKGT